MTELILGSRCSGKTTELIKRSATDGTYILTGTKTQAKYIFDQARLMGYDIPFPVTWEQFKRDRFHGTDVRKKGVLIDETAHILYRIFGGIPIKGVTWTKIDFKDLDLENPNNRWIGKRL